jgi:hypothetical protein
MADLIAATSPQRSVKENVKLAEDVFDCLVLGLDWKETGGMCHKSHWPNVERAIRREPLCGQKVRAFAANLKGDLSQITIDTIIWRFYRGYEWITPRRYEKLAKKLKAAARRHGLKPAEYQAVLWVKIRIGMYKNLPGGIKSLFE